MFIVFANVIQLLEYGWYYISNSLSPSSKEVFKEFTFQIFNSYLVVFSAGIGISALKLLTDQWLSQSRYAQLEKEKAQTELSFLKAQINPHFLFNSINSIFAHIDKSNVIAREIVLKFSDMLRYQLYDCNSDKISFEKEIAYLINYVELQRLRKDEKLELKFETIGEMFGFEIAPLVLIPFLENAFKYASNHDDKQNLLKIILTKETDYFSFYCSNTKDNIVSGSLVDEGGIGIANVKRRLELIYPGKHELMINNNKDSFEVKLKIQII
ncbi:MAG TPA: sensor histidine kinase [Saprospiraceae bacterium]|nr:sensor histidine kinase [Saprospiraceae bacterium]